MLKKQCKITKNIRVTQTAVVTAKSLILFVLYRAHN